MSQNMDTVPPPNEKDHTSNYAAVKSDTTVAASPPTFTNATTTNSPKFTLPQEIPKLPSLRESIQDFVIATNNALSSLEIKYQERIQQPTTQAIHQIADTTSTVREQFHQLYQQQRQVYGPYTIIGTSLLVGGITTLRRGRMSGIVSTVVVGGLSYGIIYGLHDMDDNETSPAVDLAKLLPQRITDLWKSK